MRASYKIILGVKQGAFARGISSRGCKNPVERAPAVDSTKAFQVIKKSLEAQFGKDAVLVGGDGEYATLTVE
jgi:hypothetical protein